MTIAMNSCRSNRLNTWLLTKKCTLNVKQMYKRVQIRSLEWLIISAIPKALICNLRKGDFPVQIELLSTMKMQISSEDISGVQYSIEAKSKECKSICYNFPTFTYFSVASLVLYDKMLKMETFSFPNMLILVYTIYISPFKISQSSIMLAPP